MSEIRANQLPNQFHIAQEQVVGHIAATLGLDRTSLQAEDGSLTPLLKTFGRGALDTVGSVIQEIVTGGQLEINEEPILLAMQEGLKRKENLEVYNQLFAGDPKPPFSHKTAVAQKKYCGGEMNNRPSKGIVRGPGRHRNGA